MGYEVEVKYRTGPHDDLAARLAALGASAAGAIVQEDAYLSHPARDFAQTNEALRLRRVGEANRITYKGPRRAGPTKTREEIELPLGEGPEASERWLKLFENLGFRPVAVIRKVRRAFRLSWRGRPVEVALDEVEGVGTFAEVEAIAGDEADLPSAQAAVLDLAAALGLSEAQVEPRSYLRMALERRGAAATPAENPSGQTGADLV
jgi:adenylate cyclase, class 2